MFLKKRVIRTTLLAAVTALTGCAGLPGAPAVSADSPLVDVVLPDVVLGRNVKDASALRQYSKADALKESPDIQSFCSPGGLSRFGRSFLDSNDVQAFNEAMVKGLDIAKRRHEWTFESVKANKQSELLNAFLSGRGGAFFTPEKFNQLRRENAAYQQSQGQGPNLRIGRTSMHMVPAAVDGVNHNVKVLTERDKPLQESERWYRDEVFAIYKSALRKQMAVAPEKVTLDQITQFDVFRNHSVIGCLSRAGLPGKEGMDFVEKDATYAGFARNVIFSKLPEIYNDLASAKTSESLQLGMENRFPTRNLLDIALADPGFSKKTSALMASLREKEAAVLAERRRQESQAVAAVERQRIESFRQKAARGVVPSKDEFVNVLLDTVFSNTERHPRNFAYKFVRDDITSFSMYFLSVKTNHLKFEIDDVKCVPSAGKINCSWSEKMNVTEFRLLRDRSYQKTNHGKVVLGWTDQGLRCLSDCSWYVGFDAPGGGQSQEPDSNRSAIDRDQREYNQEASERYRERQEENMRRQQQIYNDNNDRIQNSGGRCRSASNCPY